MDVQIEMDIITSTTEEEYYYRILGRTEFRGDSMIIGDSLVQAGSQSVPDECNDILRTLVVANLVKMKNNGVNKWVVIEKKAQDTDETMEIYLIQERQYQRLLVRNGFNEFMALESMIIYLYGRVQIDCTDVFICDNTKNIENKEWRQTIDNITKQLEDNDCFTVSKDVGVVGVLYDGIYNVFTSKPGKPVNVVCLEIINTTPDNEDENENEYNDGNVYEIEDIKMMEYDWGKSDIILKGKRINSYVVKII